MTEIETVQRLRVAYAMLVAIGPKLAETCTALLNAQGVGVVSVAHVPAALERMAIVMPLVVVGDADATVAEREELRDRAVAVGAHTLWFPRDADGPFVASALRLAAAAALEKLPSV